MVCSAWQDQFRQEFDFTAEASPVATSAATTGQSIADSLNGFAVCKADMMREVADSVLPEAKSEVSVVRKKV